ncbi:hypothetical protein ABPG72_009680 [Tetrahymena utriculariae]
MNLSFNQNQNQQTEIQVCDIEDKYNYEQISLNQYTDSLYCYKQQEAQRQFSLNFKFENHFQSISNSSVDNKETQSTIKNQETYSSCISNNDTYTFLSQEELKTSYSVADCYQNIQNLNAIINFLEDPYGCKEMYPIYRNEFNELELQPQLGNSQQDQYTYFQQTFSANNQDKTLNSASHNNSLVQQPQQEYKTSKILDKRNEDELEPIYKVLNGKRTPRQQKIIDNYPKAYSSERTCKCGKKYARLSGLFNHVKEKHRTEGYSQFQVKKSKMGRPRNTNK